MPRNFDTEELRARELPHRPRDLEQHYRELFENASDIIYETCKQESQCHAPSVQGGSETILIADDEGSLRELACNILEDLGYEVLIARDGAEAVEIYKAERERISLLMFDMVMPRLRGYEAYEHLRALDKDVAPLILMTGYSTETLLEMMPEISGVNILQKPYSIQDMGNKVREMLDEVNVSCPHERELQMI